MKKKVTMKDIAKKLNISSVTVSKALNDKDGVSDELKKKIKELADEMGYRINTLAKSMKEGLSYNVGVIIAEQFAGDAQSFYLLFYQKIVQMLEVNNYYGVLHILSEEDEQNLRLPRIYYENRVDGFIVLGQISKKYIEALKEHEIPTVLLDFYDEDISMDSVITDNFYGAYEVTNYLMKSGHKDIAFVGNIYATSSIQDRFLGYHKSILEHKIELRQEYIINDREDSGKYVEFKFPDKMPTAFVCNCDQVAYNLINKLKELGHNVPEDFSVVGFDNDIYATISDPAITTVAVNVEEMSNTAVEYILGKIKNEEQEYGRTTIQGDIIYRNSVKVLK